MIRSGYNHSVPIDGKVLHVQTEHHETPDAWYIETEVFREGRVLFSRRLNRKGPAVTPEELRTLDGDLRKIHKAVITKLITGDLALDEEAASDLSGPVAIQMAKVDPVHSPMQDRQLRKQLYRFVHAVGQPEPGEEEVVQRIRSATTAMAVILGSSSHSFMRRDDLAELVMLRSEAASYLSQPPGLEEGLRLWCAFAQLARSFMHINERRGLIQLDHETLIKVRERLQAQSSGRLSKIVVEQLSSCVGRDAALDRLLGTPNELTAEVVAPVLDRLIDSLGTRLSAMPAKQSQPLAVIA